MKPFLLGAAAAALLCAASVAPAAAQDRGFYGRLDLGVPLGGNVESEGNALASGATLPQPFADDQELDIGWQAAVAAGVTEFPLPNWRVELEAVYNNQETDDAADNLDDIFDTGDDDEDIDVGSADVSVWGGFANLIYDFDWNDGEYWQPYLGAGVGWGNIDVDFGDVNAEDDAFLWQVKAGLLYPVNANNVLEFGYRYISGESAEFERDELDLNVSGEVDVDVHAVTAGWRWQFGAAPF